MGQQEPPRILEVREMAAADTPWSARLHVDALPHGLFPLLGHRFVQRWHLGHLRSPYGVGFVAELDGEAVGMLIGTTDQLGHVRWVLAEDRLPMVVRGVTALLARPRVLWHFVRTRSTRYGRRMLRRDGAAGRGTRSSSAASTRHRVAVVEAIVVLPQAQRSGAGRALVDALLDAAARAGTAEAELVTKADAEGGSRFYTSLGWDARGEHLDKDGDLVRLFATPTRRRSTTPACPDHP